MNRSNISNISLALISGILFIGISLGIYIGLFGFSPLIIIALLAIPFAILCVLKPWIAVSLFLFLIPLESLFVVESSITASLTKLIGIYLASLIIITGAFKHIHEVFRFRKVYWIILFGILSVISILYSKDQSHSIIFSITLWLSIILYFTLVMMIRNIWILNSATWALVLGSVVSVLSPIVLGFGNTNKDILVRYGGLIGDQNDFAALLLIVIPLSVFLYLRSYDLKLRILSGGSSLILMLGFILTYSRGGYIAFTALILITMYKFIKGKNRPKVLIPIMLLIIISFTVIYNTVLVDIVDRVDTLRSLENEEVITDNSLKVRYNLYFKYAPRVIAENPILGEGFRTFELSNPYDRIAHNTFLEVFTGIGIVGLIPFIVIIVISWLELKKTQTRSPKNKEQAYISGYSNALELGFLSFLIAGLFLSLDINKMMWITITLCTILVNISKIRDRSLNHQNYTNKYTEYSK